MEIWAVVGVVALLLAIVIGAVMWVRRGDRKMGHPAHDDTLRVGGPHESDPHEAALRAEDRAMGWAAPPEREHPDRA